jgi:L-asparaginase
MLKYLLPLSVVFVAASAHAQAKQDERPTPEAKQDERPNAEPKQAALPNIVILATGGTIAGAAASDVQAGYSSGQVGVEQLLAAVPQAKMLANHSG